MMNSSYQFPNRTKSDILNQSKQQEELKTVNTKDVEAKNATPNTSQQNNSYCSSGASGDSDETVEEDDSDEGYFDQDGIGLYRSGKSM